MRIRTVRDFRYRYLNNFTPEVPFLAPNNYKEKAIQFGICKELNAEVKLTPAQGRALRSPYTGRRTLRSAIGF
jgi:N-sulfoglucosamine sulfohydrolase